MRCIYDDDLIRIRYYGHKVKGLGDAKHHTMIQDEINPGAFQVLAPFFERFQVLDNLRALTTPLDSLVCGPYYLSIIMQPNTKSLTLELLTTLDPELSKTITTPLWKSWENVMNAILVLPSINNFIIAYMQPSCIPGNAPPLLQITHLNFI